MSTYLLLRSNKESGPYSFEELRSKGLKAYDLVWIEGRSAAWRYPSEVEELKAFAPIVEEQPFDRFYKRSAQVNASTTTENNTNFSVPPRPIPEKELSFAAAINSPVISTEPSSIPGKRIIYVTLPSDAAAQGMRVPSFREPSTIQSSTPAAQEIRTLTNEKEPVRTELSSLYVKSALPAEEKFSQDSEDMWKSTVELTPRQQRPGMKRFLQPVLTVACVLALLAAGIFIGLSIKGDSFGFSQKTEVKETSPAPMTLTTQQDRVPPSPPPASVAVQTASTPPPDPDATANINPSNVSTVPASTQNFPASTQNDPAPIAAITPKKKAGKIHDRSSLGVQKFAAVSLPAKDSAAMSVSVVHREAIHRNDETAPGKDAIRSSIANMLSVGTGKYSVGTFGGISDLQMTVSNHSLYPIDLVVVEVQYITASKKVYKTENLYFRGLGPGAAVMQEAPKSSRGVKIQYRITLVNSKEMGLSYSGV